MSQDGEFTFIDGKHCVRHGGLAVLKHSCGEYLCKECVRDSDNCPHCDGQIKLPKKRTAPKKPAKVKEEVPKPEEAPVEPEPKAVEVQKVVTEEPKVVEIPKVVTKEPKKVDVPMPPPPPKEEDDVEEEPPRPLKKKNYTRL